MKPVAACHTCGRVPPSRTWRGQCAACRAGVDPTGDWPDVLHRVLLARRARWRDRHREAVRAYMREYHRRPGRLETRRETQRRWARQRWESVRAAPALLDARREQRRLDYRAEVLAERQAELGWHTRADCRDGERPCPLAHCRFHLADVAPPEHLREHSCVLDLADRGGMTLERVAAVLGCTREWVRQIEAAALKKLRPRGLRAGLGVGVPR